MVRVELAIQAGFQAHARPPCTPCVTHCSDRAAECECERAEPAAERILITGLRSWCTCARQSGACPTLSSSRQHRRTRRLKVSRLPRSHLHRWWQDVDLGLHSRWQPEQRRVRERRHDGPKIWHTCVQACSVVIARCLCILHGAVSAEALSAAPQDACRPGRTGHHQLQQARGSTGSRPRRTLGEEGGVGQADEAIAA